jgi:hypothetical protein
MEAALLKKVYESTHPGKKAKEVEPYPEEPGEPYPEEPEAADSDEGDDEVE